MGLFTKKKDKDKALTEITCQHKYQDFPWYIEGRVYNEVDYPFRRKFTIQIKEPYVCTICGDRHDKILFTFTSCGNEKDAEREMKHLEEKFASHLRHKAEIEDMINDMQLVDINYLKYYHMLQGTDDPSTSRMYEEFKLKL